VIPKPTQIEIGNLLRGADKPILIKEKTDENGATILRIYQRKDLRSISSPFEKIKNALKYSLEDFGREHKTAAKLLDKIGFGKVRALVTKAPDKAADLIETMRSGARTGLIDEKSKKEFDSLLHENNISKYDSFEFYEDTYSDQDFEQDLKYISEKIEDNSPSFSRNVVLAQLSPGEINLNNFSIQSNRADALLGAFKEIKKEIEIFFKNQNTEKKLQEEFFKKLNKIVYEPIVSAWGIETTKNWLLQHEITPRKIPGNARDQYAIIAQETAINSINSAFSNHWWDSDEKKIKSMVNLYYRYKDSKDVPKIITAYIYFSVEKLLKKNPDLKEIVKELQEAHDDIERAANRIESKQQIQGADDDQA
jgi:hypothetical protein